MFYSYISLIGVSHRRNEYFSFATASIYLKEIPDFSFKMIAKYFRREFFLLEGFIANHMYHVCEHIQ